VIEIPATPQPLAERMERLERENRNLLARLEKLEKRGGAVVFEIVRTAILLVVAAVLLHLMGLLPGNLERVPVVAREVRAEKIRSDLLEVKEVTVLDRTDTGRAKLDVRENEPRLTFFDSQGRITAETPSRTKP